MAVFFEKLQAQGGARAPQFLSDHPDPGNRAVAIMDEVATLPRKTVYRQDSAEFRQIKQMASGHISGPPQKSVQQRLQPAGSETADAGAPDGSFRTLEQRAFRIGYPGNWKVSGGGQTPFIITPEMAGPGRAPAYSAMIGGFQSRNESNLGAQTRELFASMEQRNPALKMVGSEQDIRINGVPGKSVDLIGSATVGGDRQRHWLVTVPQHGQGIIYLLFTAPEAEFDQIRPAFEEMVRSLHLH